MLLQGDQGHKQPMQEKGDEKRETPTGSKRMALGTHGVLGKVLRKENKDGRHDLPRALFLYYFAHSLFFALAVPDTTGLT